MACTTVQSQRGVVTSAGSGPGPRGAEPGTFGCGGATRPWQLSISKLLAMMAMMAMMAMRDQRILTLSNTIIHYLLTCSMWFLFYGPGLGFLK